ncbi:MAG: hypothetical protein IT310_10740 [Anaerolineales bacterium]|nr:hypothetical protein [Anaerolineales bacterium]
MFDIYLFKGCIQSPESILLGEKITQKTMRSVPEYLGLNISLLEAKRMLVSLKNMKATGTIVPTKYRDATLLFDFDEAFVVANSFFATEKMKYPGVFFFEAKYVSAYSSLMYYTFFSASKEWLAAGLIPGALFVNIDKIDGHIWTDSEKKELDAYTY